MTPVKGIQPDELEKIWPRAARRFGYKLFERRPFHPPHLLRVLCHYYVDSELRKEQ
jgi:hypothetical protein